MEPNSEASWFRDNEFLDKNNITRPPDDVLPKSLFTSELTLDTLKLAREYNWRSIDTKVSADSARWYENESVRIYKKFIVAYKHNNPLNYHIVSRLKHFYYLLTQPESPFKSARYPINVFLTFIHSVINIIIFYIGIFSVILLLFKWKNIFKIFICGIPVFLFVFFAFILKGSEARNVVFAVPFLCISIAWAINYLSIALKANFKFLCFFVMLPIVAISIYYTSGAIKF
ncbi:MAG: hypothetical protein M0D57_17545 [Sphingobacteriales bacterium JAD_PAG50586_3]|nr:MAG: hypothetical protein M0D57_17545 [Sphingobacteriales bacterium JAD_PAG50586_3]